MEVFLNMRIEDVSELHFFMKEMFYDCITDDVECDCDDDSDLCAGD